MHAQDHYYFVTDAEVPNKRKQGAPPSRSALHADINPNTGKALEHTDYNRVINGVENSHVNADSYRVFASLCARSLYKRAIMRDDPVRDWFLGF